MKWRIECGPVWATILPLLGFVLGALAVSDNAVNRAIAFKNGEQIVSADEKLKNNAPADKPSSGE